MKAVSVSNIELVILRRGCKDGDMLDGFRWRVKGLIDYLALALSSRVVPFTK